MVHSFNPHIKAIIFDIDGVLVKDEQLHSRALVKALNKIGYDVRLSEISVLEGCTTSEKLNYLSTIGRGPFDRYKELYRLKEDYLEQLVDENIVADPNIHSIVAYLYPSFKLGIVTNNSRCAANKMLAKTKLLHFFDGITTKDDVGEDKVKPHPYIICKAAAYLNFIPNQCLVIDNSNRGRDAAINAGAKFLRANHNDLSIDLIEDKFRRLMI